ncbi:uncharacterized protein N7483_002656 [Penicillium malachiteum]|uniref:uncharacterized protein n=1 Tax=Penicillium malachiteum TaxID=1324776 RepID=UPI0025477BB2|nr:uncharacterized protein N7483_002656 [Penicillium malachiteum]KAJ5737531.1 hypothetical protein N7483_002656 [Penicillium malachiteum]
MTTTSIVLLQFKPEASSEDIKEVCSRMLSLKDRCLHPDTQKPYIQSYNGGVDNSIEGMQVRTRPWTTYVPIDGRNTNGVEHQKNGFTHAFVIQFQSTEDRDYCVNADTVHQDIVGSLDRIVEKAQVVDFTHGVF